jgi:hypothetical protein
MVQFGIRASMSLPTPTGNPCPYSPGHPLYSLPVNLAWIEKERHGDETDLQVCVRIDREAYEQAMKTRKTEPVTLNLRSDLMVRLRALAELSGGLG